MRNLTLVGALLLASEIQCIADPIVTVHPANASVLIGDLISLTIDISNVVDLSAFQLDIDFNPAIVAGISIVEGDFLSSGGSTVFISGIIDNNAGAILLTADTLVGPTSGVSGHGTLAIIQLAGLAPGVSMVRPSDLILLDSQLSLMSATVAPGEIRVNATPIPEPATSVLLLTGIAVSGSKLRRRRGEEAGNG
jgi:hypothetical protein